MSKTWGHGKNSDFRNFAIKLTVPKQCISYGKLARHNIVVVAAGVQEENSTWNKGRKRGIYPF